MVGPGPTLRRAAAQRAPRHRVAVGGEPSLEYPPKEVTGGGARDGAGHAHSEAGPLGVEPLYERRHVHVSPRFVLVVLQAQLDCRDCRGDEAHRGGQ